MKAIETSYAGCKFRSRLEARWATFFDALGLKWEYEPEGFEMSDGSRYLPDFKVEYPGRDESEAQWHWFEVKGDITRVANDEWNKMLRWSQESKCDLIILDGTPEARMYCTVEEWMTHYVGHDSAVTKTRPPTRIEARSMSSFKRAGWALWSGKNRLWWDEHDNYFTPTTYYGCDDAIEYAVARAKSARFEFGQCGATA